MPNMLHVIIFHVKSFCITFSACVLYCFDIIVFPWLRVNKMNVISVKDPMSNTNEGQLKGKAILGAEHLPKNVPKHLNLVRG